MKHPEALAPPLQTKPIMQSSYIGYHFNQIDVAPPQQFPNFLPWTEILTKGVDFFCNQVTSIPTPKAVNISGSRWKFKDIYGNATSI